MALWDATKPPAGGPRLSAEIRQGWESIERSLLSCSLARDPLFREWWGAGAMNCWTVSGTGATIALCGPGLGDTKEFGLGGYSAKLVYGSSTARLKQVIIASLPTHYRGKQVAVGICVNATASNAAKLYVEDGVDTTYSAAYAPAGTDGWLTVVHSFNAAATKLEIGIELTVGSVYVEGASPVWGPIAPMYFVPALPPFARGGTMVNTNGIGAAINVVAWQAPFPCMVIGLRAYRVGGTGATVNARKNGTSNHLASALSLTSADTWMVAGTVQNQTYAAGDKLEIMIVSVTGSPTQVAIQVDLAPLA